MIWLSWLIQFCCHCDEDEIDTTVSDGVESEICLLPEGLLCGRGLINYRYCFPRGGPLNSNVISSFDAGVGFSVSLSFLEGEVNPVHRVSVLPPVTIVKVCIDLSLLYSGWAGFCFPWQIELLLFATVIVVITT